MPIISERAKELKRRRLRKKKYLKFKDMLSKNPSSEQKATIIAKLRKMTPGAEKLIEEWGLN